MASAAPDRLTQWDIVLLLSKEPPHPPPLAHWRGPGGAWALTEDLPEGAYERWLDAMQGRSGEPDGLDWRLWDHGHTPSSVQRSVLRVARVVESMGAEPEWESTALGWGRGFTLPNLAPGRRDPAAWRVTPFRAESAITVAHGTGTPDDDHIRMQVAALIHGAPMNLVASLDRAMFMSRHRSPELPEGMLRGLDDWQRGWAAKRVGMATDGHRIVMMETGPAGPSCFIDDTDPKAATERLGEVCRRAQRHMALMEREAETAAAVEAAQGAAAPGGERLASVTRLFPDGPPSRPRGGGMSL